MPQLDPNLFSNSPASLYQALQAVAWPFFCQCVAGTPAPINFPPPTFVPPAGWPSSPIFACDPANLCAALIRIESLLNTVAGQVNAGLNLTTLIQRYSLPFAVVPGAFHNGLVGEGNFSVPRLVGIEYDLVTQPDTTLTFAGVPPYKRDLGWIGLELPGGGVMEHRVTRDHEFWMPDEAQLSTVFGYSLKPGVTINVRELYAET